MHLAKRITCRQIPLNELTDWAAWRDYGLIASDNTRWLPRLAKPIKTQRIKVDGIVSAIGVKIHASRETDFVFGCPSSDGRIVVASTEADEAGVAVVEASGEAEGLEAGVGVEENDAELVIVDALGDGSVGGVNDEADAAEMVGDDAVHLAAFEHIRRDVAFFCIHKLGDDVIGAVEFGDGIELVFVDEFLDGCAVNGFADAAVFRVDGVGDVGSVEVGTEQVAKRIVIIVHHGNHRRHGSEVASEGVGILR